ncbi:MAG: type II toxin-antitoxin system VapC family toxin [Polaromonas sp.]|nr:type II toxin-antitoxin system VapC family toxin [Polaromonas sp.]
MSLTTGSAPYYLHVAEPPAQYIARPSIVVDCSALAGMLFEEPWQAQAREKIYGRTLNAPFLLEVEIASVALKKHKQGLHELVAEGLASFKALNVALHQIKPADVLALALQYKLSAYDASYLWLAAELKAPLATFDEKLAEAATNHFAGLP